MPSLYCQKDKHFKWLLFARATLCIFRFRLSEPSQNLQVLVRFGLAALMHRAGFLSPSTSGMTSMSTG